MLELGEDSIKEHIKIAEAINQSTIDIVLTFGDISKNITDSISKSKYSKHYIEKKKLKIELNNLICKNDIIYIKGSRGMKLERIFLNN
jgi:UDP-N-acetylmuramoyl-tripeptide--D-alanyl-D-alanine ligase